MPHLLALLLAFACLLDARPAAADKRVALVVGNSAYKAVGRLANAVNDAELVTKALRAAQFKTIEARSDLDNAEFRLALRRFRAQAEGADVALVYFAGHGIEAFGVNWLIPIDAELAEAEDLEFEAIKTDLVLQALNGARLRVLALDACRNNPFARGWRSSTREVSNGLKRIEADDVLVLFAAAPGQTASDGADANSPFATALARRLPQAGLALQLLGAQVRDDVILATKGKQRPFVNASMTAELFYFVPAPGAVVPPPPAATTKAPPPPPPPEVTALGEAERVWAQIKEMRDPAVHEAFIRRYGNTVYGDLARARMATLSKEIETARQEALRREEAARREEEAARREEALRREEERRIKAAAAAKPPPTPPPPPAPVISNHTFDGHWYSPEWKYGYRLYDGVGVASSSNSPKFKAGDVIIRIQAVGPHSFEGRQVYRDGRWYHIKGTLRSDGKIYIEGEKNVSWYVQRID